MAVQILPNLNMTPFDFSHDGYMADALQPSVDYGSGYLNMPFYIQQPDYEYTAGHHINGDASSGGPFLSVQQPASPDMNSITPRQAHFAHHTPNLNTVLYNNEDEAQSQRHTSSSYGIGNGNGNGNEHSLINSRYVSGSAFPDTPLSVDPSGLGSLDRRISYANNARLDWPDDVDDQDQDSGNGAGNGGITETKVEKTSPTKQTLPLSPLSPSNQHPVSASSPAIKSPIPRPGRRARSVASAFT
jgi:hypothetical protein